MLDPSEGSPLRTLHLRFLSFGFGSLVEQTGSDLWLYAFYVPFSHMEKSLIRITKFSNRDIYSDKIFFFYIQTCFFNRTKKEGNLNFIIFWKKKQFFSFFHLHHTILHKVSLFYFKVRNLMRSENLDNSSIHSFRLKVYKARNSFFT